MRLLYDGPDPPPWLIVVVLVLVAATALGLVYLDVSN